MKKTLNPRTEWAGAYYNMEQGCTNACPSISCQWFGRVALPEYRIGLEGTPEAGRCLDYILSAQTPAACRAVYNQFKNNDLIHFKNDFLKLIGAQK